MYISSRSLLILTLVSCTSLPHFTQHVQSGQVKTKHHIKLEEKIAEKETNIKRDGVLLSLGLALFYAGVKDFDAYALTKKQFVFQIFGAITTGTAFLLSVDDTTKLLKLKNRLEKLKIPASTHN